MGFFKEEEVQNRHMLNVLEQVEGNKARAAEILGIGRATVYQMLAKIRKRHATGDPGMVDAARNGK